MAITTINRSFVIPAFGTKIYLLDSTGNVSGTGVDRLNFMLSTFYNGSGMSKSNPKVPEFCNLADDGISFKVKRSLSKKKTLGGTEESVAAHTQYGELEITAIDFDAEKLEQVLSLTAHTIAAAGDLNERKIYGIVPYNNNKKYSIVIQIPSQDYHADTDDVQSYNFIVLNQCSFVPDFDLVIKENEVSKTKFKMICEFSESVIDADGNPGFGWFLANYGGI